MKLKLDEMLVRKGYSREVIQICLEELKDEKDDESNKKRYTIMGINIMRNIRSMMDGHLKTR